MLFSKINVREVKGLFRSVGVNKRNIPILHGASYFGEALLLQIQMALLNI